jgi:hypothetical protein
MPPVRVWRPELTISGNVLFRTGSCSVRATLFDVTSAAPLGIMTPWLHVRCVILHFFVVQVSLCRALPIQYHDCVPCEWHSERGYGLAKRRFHGTDRVSRVLVIALSSSIYLNFKSSADKIGEHQGAYASTNVDDY